MDREGPGGAGRGPVQDGEDFSRARIFPHQKIFAGGKGPDHAELDGGGFHAEASVGAGEERVELAHAVGAGSIQRLTREQWRQTNSPLPMPFGVTGGRPLAVAFLGCKIVAGELIDGEVTRGNDGCRRGREGADARLEIARSDGLR